MNIIYPINGKNERMGSLFSTPKHLLLYKGISLIEQSIRSLQTRFAGAMITILTNETYYDDLVKLVSNDVMVQCIPPTNSQIETLRTITTNLYGSCMFVDCDILPTHITNFDNRYSTVFTFLNDTNLLNYSNFKCDSDNNILECNEKQKLYKFAGAGIYYFSDVNLFNQYSISCKNVSECISLMLKDQINCKINFDSTILRFGTLQDIYIDNFSFRNARQRDLSTGFTQNSVIKQRNKVVKTGSTVVFENDWYSAYKNKKHLPEVFEYRDNQITLEFIYRNNDINLDDIFELIDVYKTYDKLNELNFSSYINNIEVHLQKNSNITNGYKLLGCLSSLNLNPTFCHGDLSVMNMIPTTNGLKLIDPLYSKHKFGSYELDIAKLCFSFKFYKNDCASFNYVKNKSNIEYIDILIAAEAVRVASYKNEYSFIAENLINEL